MLRISILCWLMALTSTSCAESLAWQWLKKSINRQFPEVQQLTTDQLANWLQQEKALLLIDVRAVEEFAVSHLNGAYLHQNDRDTITHIKTFPVTIPIVLYCSVGMRSSKLAAQLQTMSTLEGYTFYNLQGSLFEWANQKRRLVRTVNTASGVTIQKTNQVHPYDFIWGQLLDKSLHAIE